jgi:hypothetical protein
MLQYTKTCLCCQQWKTAPLPIPDLPNTRIHAEIFGPMVNANIKSAYILCFTDAFAKYMVVTTVTNKDVQKVAKAIFEECLNLAYLCKSTWMVVKNL